MRDSTMAVGVTRYPLPKDLSIVYLWLCRQNVLLKKTVYKRLTYHSKQDKALPAQQKKREFGGVIPMPELPLPSKPIKFGGHFYVCSVCHKVSSTAIE